MISKIIIGIGVFFLLAGGYGWWSLQGKSGDGYIGEGALTVVATGIGIVITVIGGLIAAFTQW